MIPGMIAEDDDRPVPMKPKLDVLDYWSLIQPGCPACAGCARRSPLHGRGGPRRRLTTLGDAGFEGIVFVRCPHHERRRRLRCRPTDALSIYDQVVDNRGVILIPTREGEQGRFEFKCSQGANYGLTQLLYSDAIVGFLTDFAKNTDHRPEILLSFGFVPKVETRVGLIDWLIQDPGNAAVAASRSSSGHWRAAIRRQAPADGRPVQAGDRRCRRSRLSVEHPLRGDIWGVRRRLRDVRGDARYWSPDR